MHKSNASSTPNLLENSTSSNQLIRFPTITKLIYDGNDTIYVKNSFKSTTTKFNSKISSMLPISISNLTQNNGFRLVEVPHNDYMMRISMMNINQVEERPRPQRQIPHNMSSRQPQQSLIKQRSVSEVEHMNHLQKRASLASINKTVAIPMGEEGGQQKKNNKADASVRKNKLKINFRLHEIKVNINEIYFQVVSALVLTNAKAKISQSKNYQRIRRAKVDKGNNGFLVKQMIKKRIWWNCTDEVEDANMIWTQKNIPVLKCDEPFYTELDPSEQQIVFQRNIDYILQQYPRILQLFFTEDQLQKLTTESSKNKRVSELYNLLTSIKPMRKIYPENVVLYNHIPNNFHICSKKMLYKNMWTYYHENGRNPYLYLPKTYHLTAFDWQEKVEFVKGEEKQAKDVNLQQGWFLKPGENTNRGRGIQIFKSSSQALDYIIRNPPKTVNKTYILQKSISPLLYNNRKFDIRCYMLCIQAFQTQNYYWYQQGYIRTSSQKFTMNKTSISIHLTNDAIQKQQHNYDKYQTANKLSYADIHKYIRNQYELDFLHSILPKMKNIACDLCRAANNMGATGQKADSQGGEALFFQVFGLDFIISNQGEPYLLEVNTNPCLEINSNLLSRVIPEMIQNTFRIVNDVFLVNRASGSNTGPDWIQNFFQFNKYSLLHRRELDNYNKPEDKCKTESGNQKQFESVDNICQ